MAGMPVRRHREKVAQEVSAALTEFDAKAAKKQSTPRKDIDAVYAEHRNELKGMDNVHDRLDKLCDLLDYDPFVRLVFITTLRPQVSHFIAVIDQLIESGSLTDDQTKELQALIKFFKLVPLDTRGETKVHEILLKYRAPQLKASEVKQTIDQTVTINVKKFGS